MLLEEKEAGSKRECSQNQLHWREQSVSRQVGFIAVFGYAFFKLPTPWSSQLFDALLIVVLLVGLVAAPGRFRHDRAMLYPLGAILLALFAYIYSNVAIPKYAEPYPYLDVLLDLFMFYAVAWSLAGRAERPFYLIATALAGFGIALSVHSSFEEIRKGLEGTRLAFGFRNPQHAAMYFGTALLGWVVFAKRVTGGWKSWARIGLWVAVFVLLLTGTVLTQTRAAWLGIIAAIVVGTPFSVLAQRRIRWSGRRTRLLFVVVFGAIIGVLLLMKNVIEARLVLERDSIEKVTEGQFAILPEDSVGARIKLWSVAVEKIAERPWTGWGYTGRGRIIDDSPQLSPLMKELFGHFHNSYLEILIIYGIPGVLLISALVAWIGFQAWNSWRHGVMPTDMFAFGIVFAAFWFLANMFESYVLWGTGTYLVALVAGTLYTYRLNEVAAVKRV